LHRRSDDHRRDHLSRERVSTRLCLPSYADAFGPHGDDGAGLEWPDLDAWLAALTASPLLAPPQPLRLEGTRLYLDRYWQEEIQVERDLRARAGQPPPLIADDAALHAALQRLFPGASFDEQRTAADTAVRQWTTVLSGGPGTGKTTTVAGLLALLAEQAERIGARRLRIALAAPTGKAAARLEEAVRHEMTSDRFSVEDRARLGDINARTLHMLLGRRPDTSTRFRHNRDNRLPHDVVVVDETSMVALPLLARLLGAVREEARVVLLGDPHQLASVEAGSVLADVVGDDAAPSRSTATHDRLADATGDGHLDDTVRVDAGGVHDAIVVLDRVHRFVAGSGLDRFAAAVRDGDDWLLSGEKWFVTDGEHAGVFAVLAHADGDEALFLVPRDTPGVRITGTPDYMHDPYISRHVDLVLEDCRVSDRDRIPEGGGESARMWFSVERLMIAARCCGSAERILEIGIARRVSLEMPRERSADAVIVFNNARAIFSDVADCLLSGGAIYLEVDRRGSRSTGVPSG
jgi:hypothetical protein